MTLASGSMRHLTLPLLILLLLTTSGPRWTKAEDADTRSAPPNVILLMADDQGWGDVGYHGHPILRTPHLDAMAAGGLRLERFYAAAPVCSPTRGSCLTGRHPSRYGIPHANRGHMRRGELTLAEALRTRGYQTGHFGKWHLGTLTTDVRDSNRGGRSKFVQHHAPPWRHGFERCFSTEAKVPTWNPMVDPKKPGEQRPYGTHYWNERGEIVTENLSGDDSRVIMDRVIPFVRGAAEAKRPFLAVVWFHAPHLPVVAGPRHLALYPGVVDMSHRHYYGCLSALDEQLGRLRAELRSLGIEGDTLLWYTSDNGPETSRGRSSPGRTGPFRGRKRSLLEGGVRVPALLEWPGHIAAGRESNLPCSTSDILPTVLELVDERKNGQIEGLVRPLDGESLAPLIEGSMERRGGAIAFASNRQLALHRGRWKIYSADGGERFALYDLDADPGEARDLSREHPSVLAGLRAELDAWRASCAASDRGADYRAESAPK